MDDETFLCSFQYAGELGTVTEMDGLQFMRARYY